MKFTLIFTICAQMYQHCLPPTSHKEVYTTHYECATAGYEIAQEMLVQMGQNRVNNDQIVIAFACEPKMDI